MPKKHTLYLEEEHEFSIIGISTALKEYKLCFHLNKSLNTELKKIEDFHFGKRKEEYMFFPLFYCSNPSSPNISLIKNKNKNCILFPVFKHIDYLMVCHKTVPSDLLSDYLRRIKSIQNVITAFTLKTDNIRNFSFFLAELEIHLLESEEKKK